jgi:hypothetical protein
MNPERPSDESRREAPEFQPPPEGRTSQEGVRFFTFQVPIISTLYRLLEGPEHADPERQLDPEGQ